MKVIKANTKIDSEGYEKFGFVYFIDHRRSCNLCGSIHLTSGISNCVLALSAEPGITYMDGCAHPQGTPNVNTHLRNSLLRRRSLSPGRVSPGASTSFLVTRLSRS